MKGTRYAWEDKDGYLHAVRLADAEGHSIMESSDRPQSDIVLKPEHARLFAAAPELRKALKAVEWEGWTVGGEDPPVPCCPSCGAYRADVRIEPEEATSDAQPGVHVKDCELAAALAKAGR